MILFLAANPRRTDYTALDREARSIQLELKRSGHRDRFAFVTWWAAEPLDLLRGLRELKPAIVHFSGHGDGSVATTAEAGSARDTAAPGASAGLPGGLYFHSATGSLQVVTPEAFADTFGAVDAPRLVLLNACYTAPIARALLAHVDCVVGMTGAIHDDAARSFAIGFYGGLGERESIARAFKQGKAAIRLDGLPDADQPQLQVRDGCDAAQLVLAAVAPEGGPSLLVILAILSILSVIVVLVLAFRGCSDFSCASFRRRSEYLQAKLELERRASSIQVVAPRLSNLFITNEYLEEILRREIAKRHPGEIGRVVELMQARSDNINNRLDRDITLNQVIVVFSLTELQKEVNAEGTLARGRVANFVHMMDSHRNRLRACDATIDKITAVVEGQEMGSIIFDEGGEAIVVLGKQIQDSQEVLVVEPNRICGSRAETSREIRGRARGLIGNCDFETTSKDLHKIAGLPLDPDHLSPAPR